MSNSLKGILIAAACVAVLAVASNPAPERCVQEVMRQQAGSLGELGNELGVGEELYRVENDIFYSAVYNRLTGRKVAMAYFGTVTLQ